MRYFYSIFIICFLSTIGFSQSYPPAGGMIGSTAILKSDPVFVAWATNVEVNRGLQNISKPDLGFATTGEAKNAIGPANGFLVSLGDRGEAVLTFKSPIINGPGFDFAVFENGNIIYLELAIVTVSSDGIHYFGFPTHSQTQTQIQIGTFDAPEPEYLNNIAGKYTGNYGTPFDLSEVENNVLLDKTNITHIKITDVVGSIDPQYATFDSFGNAINDSFPTPFDSGGFDLDAVGVIHQLTLNTNDFSNNPFVIYPNPATEILYFNADKELEINVYEVSGRIIKVFPKKIYNQIIVSDLKAGIYIFEILCDQTRFIKKVTIQ